VYLNILQPFPCIRGSGNGQYVGLNVVHDQSSVLSYPRGSHISAIQ